jgi:8-oxo-dGTP pyrophosphatase MutT (NUDIX family)
VSRRGEKREGSEEDFVRVHSAGGVVIKKGGDGPRVAVMRSRYGTWVLPKGEVEKGERPEDAARREVREEIGVRVGEVLGELGWTEHEFERDGQQYRKRVDWFLFEAAPEAGVKADPEEGVVDCGWFTRAQALSLLSHASQRRLVRLGLREVNERQADREGRR